MSTSETPCPVCATTVSKWEECPQTRDGNSYDCPNCGKFLISRTSLARLENRPVSEKAVLSHQIWKNQSSAPAKHYEVASTDLDAARESSLPNPAEKLDLLVLYLGTKLHGAPGALIVLPYGQLRAKVGALDINDVTFIVRAASQKNLIEFKSIDSDDRFKGRLTLDGWQYFQELERGRNASRTGQASDSQLDSEKTFDSPQARPTIQKETNIAGNQYNAGRDMNLARGNIIHVEGDLVQGDKVQGNKTTINRLSAPSLVRQDTVTETTMPEDTFERRGEGSPMRTRSIHISEVKGRVHAAIITIRQDEYDAVESRLGGSISVEGGNNSYELATLKPDDNKPISVALTRCVSQGDITAQSVANNIIHDLDPAWLLLVGIAGAVPDDDFSLGDVIVASALHDFSFAAALPDGTRSYETGGGLMHVDVERFLQTKIGGKNRERLLELAGFRVKDDFIRHPRMPSTEKDLADSLYGNPEWQKKVSDTVMRRFPNGTRIDGPRVLSGPCANGNLLAKDPSLLAEWQKSARQIANVETELAGVYAAARSAGRQNYPVLAIRGLSDVVGLKRDPDWTQYACNVAAAFACAVLKSGFIDFSKNLANP